MSSEDRLKAMLAAVQDQRRLDAARYARAVRELELLRREIERRNGEESSQSIRHAEIEDSDKIAVDKWQVKVAAQRAEIRKEQGLAGRFFSVIWAALFLRLARSAARRLDYAEAEIFYQAVLLYRPRAFIWRQLGNMLAGQGLFLGAVECFDRALLDNAADAEVLMVKSVALRRLGNVKASRETYNAAVQIAPHLAKRAPK